MQTRHAACLSSPWARAKGRPASATVLWDMQLVVQLWPLAKLCKSQGVSLPRESWEESILAVSDCPAALPPHSCADPGPPSAEQAKGCSGNCRPCDGLSGKLRTRGLTSDVPAASKCGNGVSGGLARKAGLPQAACWTGDAQLEGAPFPQCTPNSQRWGTEAAEWGGQSPGRG